MQELSSLANAGLAGITLASLLLVGIVIRLLFKFMSNHMNENTKAMQEHTDAVRELKEWLMHQNGKH